LPSQGAGERVNEEIRKDGSSEKEKGLKGDDQVDE
jgi:hypothetical protein